MCGYLFGARVAPAINQEHCFMQTSQQSTLTPLAATGAIMGSCGLQDIRDELAANPAAMLDIYASANAYENSVVALSQSELDSNIRQHQKLIANISADARGRSLSAREEKRLEEAQESLAVLETEFERRGTPQGRKSSVVLASDDSSASTAQRTGHAPVFATPRDPRASSRNGFRSAGEFFNAVVQGSANGASHDPRLMFNAAPSTVGTEGVGADGGFAVPPDFRATIMQKVLGEESLLSLTDQQTSASNTITFPADETTPWQSSGGIQAYWEAEGGLKGQSKPQLTEKTVKLNKVIALVPMTDELLEDASAMAGYVNRKAPEKINFKINDAILNGTGVGQPLGILTSPGTVVVAKESGQAADTVMFANIQKLWSALTPAARRNARWLMNPDVESQLNSMSFPGSGTAVPVYLPPGGLSAAPYGTLLGRPIMYTEAAQALGDQGDIVFGDVSNYLSVVKAGGIKSDVSIHLWFDYDLTAFRFVMRVGGQPWWNAPIAGFQAGTQPRGFFSTLAARA